jgi:multiple sugar transport system ATP-binding protein
MPGIVLENVTKVFPGGVTAVDALALDVRPGELLVLAGPSGCGKTTTLRLLAGLETPTQGSIRFGERRVDRLSPRERDLAMVFQRAALLPHLTVRGNLAFGLRLRGTPPDETSRRVEQAVRTLGLTELLDRRPEELSGGQQQRVALGRALVRRPAAFLLDEPLAHLDPVLRDQLRRDIGALQRQTGITMLYVTHDPLEAALLAERIAVLREGRLQQVGDPQTIYRRPANRFVARQLSTPAMNFVEGWLRQQQHDLVLRAHGPVLTLPKSWQGRLEAYVDRRVILGVRPEHLRVVAAAEAGERDEMRFEAEVETCRHVADGRHCDLHVEGQSMTAVLASGRSPAAGSRAWFAAAAAHLHFFEADNDDERAIGGNG